MTTPTSAETDPVAEVMRLLDSAIHDARADLQEEMSWSSLNKRAYREAAQESRAALESAIRALVEREVPQAAPGESAEVERKRFYAAFDEATKLTGHRPSIYDVWLMGRGLMATDGRAAPQPPARRELSDAEIDARWQTVVDEAGDPWPEPPSIHKFARAILAADRALSAQISTSKESS